MLTIAVFWVVAPCSLVEVYRRFRGTCCLHHQGHRIIAISTPLNWSGPRRKGIATVTLVKIGLEWRL
jgi:hypothetical protein